MDFLTTEIMKMKKMLSIILLTLICLMLNGCIFAIGARHTHKCPDKCPKYVNCDPDLAEIRAVRRLMSESAKLSLYNTIAQRPGLSPKARAFLADEATKNLMSESAKLNVLMTLSKNTGAAAEQK